MSHKWKNVIPEDNRTYKFQFVEMMNHITREELYTEKR